MIAKLTTYARTNQKELIRFCKFSVVGALGAVIDFGALNLLVQLAGFPKVPAKLNKLNILIAPRAKRSTIKIPLLVSGSKLRRKRGNRGSSK